MLLYIRETCVAFTGWFCSSVNSLSSLSAVRQLPADLLIIDLACVWDKVAVLWILKHIQGAGVMLVFAAQQDDL